MDHESDTESDDAAENTEGNAAQNLSEDDENEFNDASEHLEGEGEGEGEGENSLNPDSEQVQVTFRVLDGNDNIHSSQHSPDRTRALSESSQPNPFEDAEIVSTPPSLTHSRTESPEMVAVSQSDADEQ
eukprot:TRINITY_DN12684_c0_g1::TRINITY_DN12684_c0_g1_i1::g.13507::m.13507 TRINITY_DN12684_c0_g1::TRINITY_DN12684_c0_g1_i1::g.13507  ORF type:complete len:138 (-),score=36.79 TRINITY_DN12684_c0_g1_i1:629-1015(-)